MPTSLITDRDALVRWCADLADAPWIALDTEFLRERTYFAQFCLLQIAVPGRVACVDPVALDDLGPLIDLVYDTRVLKVTHAGRQDLEIFFDLRGSPPQPVFDSQLAAALLGYPDQISYAALVEAICGVKLDKAHTRTDWCARPLSAAQLQYAEDDVRYLCDLYLHLAARLNELGRTEWLAAESARLVDPATYDNAPELAYRRIRHAHTLNSVAQNVLRELAAWRERTARAANLPRNWVARDPLLFEIARRAPRDQGALVAIPELGEKAARKWGAQILEAIRHGEAAGAQPVWAEPLRFSPEQRALRERLTEIVRTRAVERAISPALLATRRDIERLIGGDTDIPLLQGWRRELVGEELARLIKGEL